MDTMRTSPGAGRGEHGGTRPRGASAAALTLVAAVVLACQGDDGAAIRAELMANLGYHCGEAFPGWLTLEPPGDEMLTGHEQLAIQFRDCSRHEVRIPFHVEIEDQQRWDRSRTWFIIRHPDRLELRHDHRHEDGSEATRTWYGGFSAGAGTPHRHDFLSPERSQAAGVPVGWRIEIVPGHRFAYGTTYDGEFDWRVEFDLAQALDPPPPLPWGYDREPSRVPGPP
jgi:hypothetical protein